jgi:hypothetical protein
MANKKRLKTIIEDELRTLMGDPETRKSMSMEDRIKVLTAAIKWASVDAKISEQEEGFEFRTGDADDDE